MGKKKGAAMPPKKGVINLSEWPKERLDRELLDLIDTVGPIVVEGVKLRVALDGEEGTSWNHREMAVMLTRCRWQITRKDGASLSTGQARVNAKLAETNGDDAAYPWIVIEISPFFPSLETIRGQNGLQITLTTTYSHSRRFTVVTEPTRRTQDDKPDCQPKPQHGRRKTTCHLRVVK